MRLVKPSLKYKQSFIRALKEFEKEGRNEGNPKDVEGYIKRAKQFDKGEVPRGMVRASTLWLVDKNQFIGRIGIRHTLNTKLKKFGGHIGYAIRPGKRKKGYGYKALELALKKAKIIGLKKVMVTCDDDNIASQKIIEKHGGKLKSKRVHEGTLIRHYWIDLEIEGTMRTIQSKT